MNDDVRDLREGIGRRLDQVFDELHRLRQENERLLQENKLLREEVTLARLQSEDEAPPLPAPRDELSAQQSRKALTFYHRLPENVHFNTFFQRADTFGLSSEDARNFLLYFIERDLLLPNGSHVRKPDFARAVSS